MKLRYSFLVASSCVLAQPVFAQDATPSHVFQRTETVRLQLAAFNDANFTSPQNFTATEQRILPRHVLQYAERVMEKVQLLRYINGLPTVSSEELPVRDVKPSDVNALVKKIEAQTSELAASYGVEVIDQASLPSGKKPADVYVNLIRLSNSLDALGVPATVPNDVYRIAQTILGALKEVASSEGLDVPDASFVAASARLPSDVYNAGIALINELEQIAGEGGRFAVPGGIVSPGPKDGPVSPAEVNMLLLRILADVDAVKFSAGLRTVSFKPSLEGGKTPTDAWRVLMETRAIVEALRAL